VTSASQQNDDHYLDTSPEERMKRIPTLIIGLTLGAAVGLHAQAKRQTPMTHTQPMSHATNSAKPATPPANSDAFKGVAMKLGTTPDALESAYESAKQADPKLSRGNFVAANMLAHNLSAKTPAVTTQAILSGLKSGKTIGQTLQGLGLSATDAENAARQAKRDAARANDQ
jgi:hypothetical protein